MGLLKTTEHPSYCPGRAPLGRRDPREGRRLPRAHRRRGRRGCAHRLAAGGGVIRAPLGTFCMENHEWSSLSGAWRMAYDAAARLGVPFVIGEGNSASCGGQPRPRAVESLSCRPVC